MRARGFTLIELAAVLSIIAAMASLAGPGYELIVRRARSEEARANLLGVAHAELAYFRDHGRFIACEPSSAEVPRGRTGLFDVSRPGWKDLGFRPEGAVRYRYQVRLEGQSFVASAQGDLDGNGKASTFSIRGDDLRVQAQDELE
jgi:prepilin-type N-terminal cleavage/methylation domain-containing protein